MGHLGLPIVPYVRRDQLRICVRARRCPDDPDVRLPYKDRVFNIFFLVWSFFRCVFVYAVHNSAALATGASIRVAFAVYSTGIAHAFTVSIAASCCASTMRTLHSSGCAWSIPCGLLHSRQQTSHRPACPEAAARTVHDFALALLCRHAWQKFPSAACTAQSARFQCSPASTGNWQRQATHQRPQVQRPQVLPNRAHPQLRRCTAAQKSSAQRVGNPSASVALCQWRRETGCNCGSRCT